MKGKTSFVDLVDCDQLSVLEINDMIQEIGYTNKHPMWYHFKIPDSDLDKGLQDLGTDQDIINLLKYTSKYKVIGVFIEHWMTNVMPSYNSPGGSHVVIEELPSQVSPEMNRKPSSKSLNASLKKQLLLEYKSLEVRDSVQAAEEGEIEVGIEADKEGEIDMGIQVDQETEVGVQVDQETEVGVQVDQETEAGV